MKYIALGFLLLWLVGAGCSKSLRIPEVDELIQSSTAIYVAELTGGEYRVTQILKNIPSNARFSISVGQRPKLLPSGKSKSHKERGYQKIIIFFEEKGHDEKNTHHFKQFEMPLDTDGNISYFHITYQELVTLIEKNVSAR